MLHIGLISVGQYHCIKLEKAVREIEGAMFRTLTALCCLGAVFSSDSCWDFTSGIPSNAGTTGVGVSWSRPLYNNVPCAVRGVLKLTPPAGATQLKVHMRITNGTGWQFNLADSPTCNGYSGDAGTAPYGYNAEFEKVNDRITLYKGISFPQPAAVETAFIGTSNDLTIRIKRGFAFATDYKGWMMSSCTNVNRLFYWDALYLGINRVVSSYRSTRVSGNRVGQGVCKLCIEWESETSGSGTGPLVERPLVQLQRRVARQDQG